MGERFAREKRLKALTTYLAPSEARANSDEVLAHMRAIKRGGVDLKIEKVG